MRKILIGVGVLLPLFGFSQEKKDSIKTVIEKQIAEIKVNGKKPFFEQKDDRFVFNVENSDLVVGNHISEVLSQTPLLKVDDNKITLLGTNASVYINDRKSILKGKDLIQYLNAMPASNLVKIELITNPSSKYDLEDAMIINLKLKKLETDGLKGSFTITDKQNRKNSQQANIALNYHKNRFSNNTMLFFENNNDLQRNSIDNYSSKTSRNQITGNTLIKETNFGGNTGFDYELNEKSSIGGILEYYHKTPESSLENGNIYNDNTGGIFENRTVNTQNDKLNLFGGNVYYSFNDDKKSKRLDINFDYYTHHRDNTTEFFNLTNPYSNLIYNDYQKDNYTVRVDYSKTFEKLKISLEVGGKLNWLSTDNPYTYYNEDGTLNTLFSNNFIYHENINALYTNVKKKLFSVLDVNLGLRYENTNISAKQNKVSENFSRSYNNIVPSINFSYMINKNNRVSLGYRTALWRPYVDDLNPFIYKNNETWWETGNQDLNVAKMYLFNASYSIKRTWVFVSNFGIVKNPILPYTEIANNISVTRPKNFEGNVKRFYVGLNYNKPLFENKWMFNLSTGMYYINNADIYDTHPSSWYNNSSVTISGNNLWNKGWNISCNFGYTSPYTLVNKKNGYFINNQIEVSKNYKDFKFKLSVKDLLNLSNSRNTLYNNDGYIETFSQSNLRSISLSISKTFGKNKVKKVNTGDIDKGRTQNENPRL
ncbi:outer membrane beta-barrel family protein [Chryseobacterium sp. R2ACT005]|uniref:outer membrane beta-barrel family protein n=1 Tax=Chryseobacterium sp. R2ACT005 TaxID=3416668 RepID=UPI003CF3E72B